MKIMVVEANRAIADHLQCLLLGDYHAIVTVTDGASAWEKIAAVEGAHPYDLIILDGSKQDLDRENICYHLRQNGCQIPILVLLETAEVQGAIAALENGADDYLIRPFSDQDLVTRIAFLVRRAQRDWRDRDQIAVQLERERLIAEITDSIRQTLDLDKILRVAVDQVRHFLETDRVIVFRFLSDWQGIVESESVASRWQVNPSAENSRCLLG